VDDLKRDAERLLGRLVEWRRTLHRHPETAFEERRTAAFVAERLRALDLETRTGVARTGVVGLLPSGRRDGTVLLRADMDALPIQEVAGRDYGSGIPGLMHACGHDGHMAMLLGAAELLAARRRDLRRDVVFCFQPAEEGLGGARTMIEEGLLESHDVREAYALHLWSQFPSGTLHVRAGAIMAAQDEFVAAIVGRGGHAALPHQAADPIVAACLAVVGLQTVVSRSVDPLEPAVVSVGSFHAGTAPNVIPGEARLHGTLRSFCPEVREILRRRVAEILEAAARGALCSLELDLRPGYPAVVNDAEATGRMRRAAIETLGEPAVVETKPQAASEDFAYFLERVPGAFAFLGSGDPARGLDAPHHSPGFDIDESVLPRGAEILARLALAPE
jgi:amidohydrolase